MKPSFISGKRKIIREHFLLNTLRTKQDGKDNIRNSSPSAYVISKTQCREKCAAWINDKLDHLNYLRSPEFMGCKEIWGSQRNRQVVQGTKHGQLLRAHLRRLINLTYLLWLMPYVFQQGTSGILIYTQKIFWKSPDYTGLRISHICQQMLNVFRQ